MDNIEDLRNGLGKELGLAVIFWFTVAAAVTFLVNRRRRTAGLAKATLFLTIWGIITVVPALLAIPTGRLALRQIQRSGGALKGRVQAWFGLIWGYSMVLVILG